MMKFKHGVRRRAAEYEKDWVQRWKDDRTFQKSVAQRPADNAYVFYDGPPFITGVPHHGTLLSSIVKDAVPRYWTMKGKRVERRWGWDCHGLPAENFVEKQLNITDRRQIVMCPGQPAPLDKDGQPLPTISLEKYITKARESMVANSETWQGVIDRIGRWVDFTGAYRTMDKDFMESVWWAFKQLYEAGKIYEGEKVLMYDTKFATPVSKAEVTMDNDAYQTVTDPSVYVKFKLKDGKTSHKIVLSEHSKVLFVCNANAARSQMAQGFYNHYSGSQNADSAGLNPEKKWGEAPTLSDFETMSRKPARSSETMQEVGIDITGHKRQLLTADKLGDYDLIVNLAEKSQTPDWLRGDNIIWWDVADPRNESVEKNRIARDEIEQRVKQLLNGEIVDDAQKPAGFDECERSYVGALLVDTNGKLIAQQRDDKSEITNPGMVSLFGGTSHEGESPIETLRRELQEELELEVSSNNLLLQTVKHENGTNVACSIYIVTGVDAEKLELHEGAGFAMGTPEELLSRPVTAVTQQAIEAFVEAQDSVSVLAWTTTPWTLPANLMLAVNPEMTYCEVLVGGEKLIIAEEALGRTLQDEKHHPLDYKVLRTFPGSELVGKKYQPLDTGSTWPENDKIHTIYAADFVSHESGTGIVHIAPAYGEDDFELAKRYGVSAFHVIDDNGYYTDGNYKGLEVWDNNKFIAKDLKEKGAVWKIEYIRHEYPFNPRSKQRIMYRAIPSWFFDIQGQKPLMLEQNEHINWFPGHLKHGRFAKNIEQAPDWNLSRDRFWATAMPVWKGDRGTVKVVGSYAELKELSGVELDDYHRPWVDDITFEIDGEKFTRIDKVLDCWFESGSMPFAQLHYPFENQAKFEQNYPADFIVEYIGQVRAWFYYVHAVNAALAEIGAFGQAGAQHKNAYSNVITTGVVAGNDGRKMSKSLGNFTDPNELMDKFSADSLRFLLLSSPLLNGEDFALHDKDVGDVARKLSMIWNMYDFFTMYAEVDGWEFSGELKDPLGELTNPLDVWIVSRLHQLVAEVERHMDTYNIPDALSPILPFLDDASNWYVRRSRRRFWKSEDDGDKNDAYRTLHYVLVRLSYILAPFTPFLAEELYRNLTGDNESIHLKDWLPAGEVNDQVLADMYRTRELINNGLSLRMKQDEHQVSIKVRQPLQCAAYAGAKLAEYYEQIMAEELNVKEIRWIESLDEHLADYDVTEGVIKPESWVEISKHLTPELKREGLMREVIRHVQSARKKAGLQVDDRIMLQLMTDDEQLRQAIDEHAEVIAAETLATFGQSDAYSTTVVIEGAELQITLQRQ
ncbi:class I tRNA ligase family protein [Candidatus Nanosynbacter sp. BB002]|uniref:class I tRNA ligase family protein n=1 Tax=Candidatus Nanosynbacter sp. BB002 TaxID=3393757 RepID=UPI0030D1803B